MKRKTTGFASLLPEHASDKAVAGLCGLLIGDAVGVLWEFYPPEELPRRDLIDIEPPAGFHHAHDVPPGTYSDDGAQALVLLDSLLICGTMCLNDFGDRLLRWYDEGHLAVDGDVFDCGIATAQALGRLRIGVPPAESVGVYERTCGNGSLMFPTTDAVA